MSSDDWVPLCSAAEVPPGTMRRFDGVDGAPPLAIYHTASGLYATADTCTHAKASLSEGDLEGDTVVCPVHWACFDVRTGKALEFPATIDLRTYPVRLTEGRIEVRVAAEVATPRESHGPGLSTVGATTRDG